MTNLGYTYAHSSAVGDGRVCCSAASMWFECIGHHYPGALIATALLSLSGLAFSSTGTATSRDLGASTDAQGTQLRPPTHYLAAPGKP